MSLTLQFLLGLHDAVGVNCKKGATSETQCTGVKYMGKAAQGCMLGECVIGLDMTTPPWWKEKVMVIRKGQQCK